MTKFKNKTYLVEWEERLRAIVKAKSETEAREAVMSDKVKAETAWITCPPEAFFIPNTLNKNIKHYDKIQK